MKQIAATMSQEAGKLLEKTPTHQRAGKHNVRFFFGDLGRCWTHTYSSNHKNVTESHKETDDNQSITSVAATNGDKQREEATRFYGALRSVVRKAFRYKHFIIFQKELEETESIARLFFHAIGLTGKDDETARLRKELWVKEEYCNQFRKLHQKYRNNAQTKIMRTMERKFIVGRHHTLAGHNFIPTRSCNSLSPFTQQA